MNEVSFHARLQELLILRRHDRRVLLRNPGSPALKSACLRFEGYLNNRFDNADPTKCRCEERSDEAISARVYR